MPFDPATFVASNGTIQEQLTAAAKRHGVDPALILAQANQESGYKPNALSHKGAYGVMQLMPATAKGLNVDPQYPSQNIEGGVKLMAQLLTKYNGDKRLALAAYNAGEGAVAKYGGVPPYKETQNYTKSILSKLENSMPFDPVAFVGGKAPAAQPDLEALGQAVGHPATLEGTNVTTQEYEFQLPPRPAGGMSPDQINASGVQLTDKQKEYDKALQDAQMKAAFDLRITKAKTKAEQQIKEAIDKKLIDTLEKAAADKGTTIDKLSRQDFQTIAKGNSKEAGELYDRLNPKFDGMSGDAAKIKEIAEGGLRQTDALGKEIMAGNKLFGASLPFGLGDRKTAFIKDDLVDLIGRLRSGGAITEGTKGGEGGEAARFERLIPGWMDFTKEEKLYKLNELGLKFQGIAESMKSDKKFVPFKTGNEQPQAVDPASDPYFGLSPEDKAALQEAEKQGY